MRKSWLSSRQRWFSVSVRDHVISLNTEKASFSSASEMLGTISRVPRDIDLRSESVVRSLLGGEARGRGDRDRMC